MFTVDELKRLASRLPPDEDRDLHVKLAELIARLERGPLVFRLELAITNPHAKARRKYRRARMDSLSSRTGEDRSHVWGPTFNEYNGLTGWQKAKLRVAVDWRITEARTRYPNSDMGVERLPGKYGRVGRLAKRGQARRRIVHVTRESSSRPDDISADVIGGKLPIDRLVQAGILFDDSDEWCVRVARWQQVPPGRGRVVLEVFELAKS